MTKKKANSDTEELKHIKDLEAAYAYAKYKMRMTGDLDSDLDDWANNILRQIEKAKAKK